MTMVRYSRGCKQAACYLASIPGFSWFQTIWTPFLIGSNGSLGEGSVYNATTLFHVVCTRKWLQSVSFWVSYPLGPFSQFSLILSLLKVLDMFLDAIYIVWFIYVVRLIVRIRKLWVSAVLIISLPCMAQAICAKQCWRDSLTRRIMGR